MLKRRSSSSCMVLFMCGALVCTNNAFAVPPDTPPGQAKQDINATDGNFSGTLTVTGLTTANGGIATTTLDASQGLLINGVTVIDFNRNLFVVNGAFAGTVSVAGLLSANGGVATTTLATTGNATIGGNLTAGNGTFSGALAANTLATTGNATVGGNLSAVGGSFSGPVSVAGLLSANGGVATTTLATTGNATIGGNLSAVNGAFSGTLTANALSTLGNVTIGGDLAVGTAKTNYLMVNGSFAGTAPSLMAQGSDANIDLVLSAKGNGSVQLKANGAIALAALSPASATNYLQAVAATAGNGPTLSAQGTDSNIALYLAGKGTGNIVAKSALSFDTAAQQATDASCAGYAVGSITTNSAGELLVCQM